jgi:hypothetical protein
MVVEVVAVILSKCEDEEWGTICYHLKANKQFVKAFFSLKTFNCTSSLMLGSNYEVITVVKLASGSYKHVILHVLQASLNCPYSSSKLILLGSR